jgi:hypothetical protein
MRWNIILDRGKIMTGKKFPRVAAANGPRLRAPDDRLQRGPITTALEYGSPLEFTLGLREAQTRVRGRRACDVQFAASGSRLCGAPLRRSASKTHVNALLLLRAAPRPGTGSQSGSSATKSGASQPYCFGDISIPL